MNYLIFAVVIVVVLVVVNTFNKRGIMQLNAQQAQEMIKDSAVTILDVRTPAEFSQGHIKKARLIPVAELASKLGELDGLKDNSILVYCHSGARSSSACQILRKNGFIKLSNLSGGISGWQSAGYSVVE